MFLFLDDDKIQINRDRLPNRHGTHLTRNEMVMSTSSRKSLELEGTPSALLTEERFEQGTVNQLYIL